MFVCTRAKSSPSNSPKLSNSTLLRRLLAVSSATIIVVLAVSGCQKPKGVDMAHQGLLVGRVIDSSSRTPVAGATLTEGPAAYTALSDPHGAFQLVLPAGAGMLSISAAGYRQTSIPIIVTPGTSRYPTKDGYILLTPLAP